MSELTISDYHEALELMAEKVEYQRNLNKTLSNDLNARETQLEYICYTLGIPANPGNIKNLPSIIAARIKSAHYPSPPHVVSGTPMVSSYTGASSTHIKYSDPRNVFGRVK